MNPNHEPTGSKGGQFAPAKGGAGAAKGTPLHGNWADPKKVLDVWVDMDGKGYKRARDPKTKEGKEMTAALGTLPEFQGTLYRGLSLNAVDLAKMKVGSTFTSTKHASTSKKREIGETFMRANMDSRTRTGVLLTIKGRGRDYSGTPRGKRYQESEAILMAGTKLKITSHVVKQESFRGKVKDVVYIEAEEA